MMRKARWIIVIALISLGLLFIVNQANDISQQRFYEKKRDEVTQMLRDDLNRFNPNLAAFVDGNYKTVYASEISSEGICTFERGLAKNEEKFGAYIVKYDLNKMKIISEKLMIRNGVRADEWKDFQKNR